MILPSPRQPSDFYPAFTWKRLSILRDLMFEARTWVADNAHPWDSKCVTGLRAFDHTRRIISERSANQYFDFLSVADEGARFLFKLDMMPIRFYRGDSEEPIPENYAVADVFERLNIEMAFEAAGQLPVEGIFRLIMKADSAGYPLAVYLVHADMTGTITLAWEIPAGDESTVAPIVIPEKPVILPPLFVRTVAEVAAAEKTAQEAAEKEQAEKARKTPKGA